MLFYGQYENPETAKALRSVVEWCLDEGQKVSDKMGYIPLPDNVVAAVRKAAADIK
jgi:phosphate transport system substrate-binding protein